MDTTDKVGELEAVALRPETCCHDELLPCPFCGNAPTTEYFPTLTRIICVPCGYHFHGHGAYSREQTVDGICYLDIRNRWNKRLLPDGQGA